MALIKGYQLSANIIYHLSIAPIRLFSGAVLILIAAGIFTPSSGQYSVKLHDAFAAAHRQSQSSSPTEITFTIRFVDGRSQFRRGEIIRLELEFAEGPSSGYIANTASYDRSGRLSIDDYHVDSQVGVVDPSYDYYHSPVGVFFGGGLSSEWPLDKEPFRITRELNEWWRFDKPGKYRLYVTSGRVGKSREESGRRAIGSKPFTVTSNMVEFEILKADTDWSERQLEEAILTLDAGEAGPDHGPRDEARRAACRVLRFLGTEAAAKEIARHYRGTDRVCDFEYHLGLFGSPHRQIVVKEMEKRLADPGHPVSTSFLSTLSLLSFTLQQKTPLLPYPDKDVEKAKQWQAEMQKRRNLYEAGLFDYVGQLATAVNSKQGEARAISIHTLFEYLSKATPTQKTRENVARQEQLTAALPEVFFALPSETQNTLLGYRWKLIAGPAMLPVVRRIFEDNSRTGTRDLRTLALRRLYELSPDEGRRLILNEIRRLRPRVGIDALKILPDETLPELDEKLVANLEKSLGRGEGGDSVEAEQNDRPVQPGEIVEYIDYPDLHSLLLVRYASEAAVSRVRTLYQSVNAGNWACFPQSAMLAYLLRFEPATGKAELKRALAARGPDRSRCWSSVLTDIVQHHKSKELLEVAMEALSDSEPEVIAMAAKVLGRYGTADVEPELWRRLEQWNAEWSKNAAELRNQMPRIPASEADLLSWQAHVESAMIDSLSRGQAWLTDLKSLKRLHELCLTDEGRRNVERIIKQQGDIRLQVSVNYDGTVSATISQYELSSITALKDKLAQYPQGTVIKWENVGSAVEEQNIFKELKSYIEERGIKFDR